MYVKARAEEIHRGCPLELVALGGVDQSSCCCGLGALAGSQGSCKVRRVVQPHSNDQLVWILCPICRLSIVLELHLVDELQELVGTTRLLLLLLLATLIHGSFSRSAS